MEIRCGFSCTVDSEQNHSKSVAYALTVRIIGGKKTREPIIYLYWYCLSFAYTVSIEP